MRLEKGEEMKPFHYRNLGSMATVGRNRAVAEFSKIKTQGWFAWSVVAGSSFAFYSWRAQQGGGTT